MQSTQDDGHREPHGLDTWIDLRHVNADAGTCMFRRALRDSWKYWHTERLALLVASTTLQELMEMQSLDQRIPRFQRTLDAGIGHLKTLMAIYRCQSAQGRSILHEDPVPRSISPPSHLLFLHSPSRVEPEHKALQTVESVPGV